MASMIWYRRATARCGGLPELRGKGDMGCSAKTSKGYNEAAGSFQAFENLEARRLAREFRKAMNDLAV